MLSVVSGSLAMLCVGFLAVCMNSGDDGLELFAALRLFVLLGVTVLLSPIAVVVGVGVAFDDFELRCLVVPDLLALYLSRGFDDDDDDDDLKPLLCFA